MKRIIALVLALLLIAVTSTACSLGQAGEGMLSGKTVGFVLADGVSVQNFEPVRSYLARSGATVIVIGQSGNSVSTAKGKSLSVEGNVAQVSADDLDALVIPGGTSHRPLMSDPRTLTLIRELHQLGRVVAANSRAPVVLGRAGVLRGKRATSWHDVRSLLKGLVGTVLSAGVVVDGNIVTSRGPNDTREFAHAIAHLLARED